MKIPPPIYFLVFLIGGFLLDRFFPIVKLGSSSWLGIVVALLGITSIVWANILFQRYKTTPNPFGKATNLVIEGPYVVTRNPMYVGMTLILLGEAIYLGSLTSFLAPLAMYYTLDTQVIPYEEKMLEEIFKEKYKTYKKRVRRWV